MFPILYQHHSKIKKTNAAIYFQRLIERVHVRFKVALWVIQQLRGPNFSQYGTPTHPRVDNCLLPIHVTKLDFLLTVYLPFLVHVVTV